MLCGHDPETQYNIPFNNCVGRYLGHNKDPTLRVWVVRRACYIDVVGFDYYCCRAVYLHDLLKSWGDEVKKSAHWSLTFCYPSDGLFPHHGSLDQFFFRKEFAPLSSSTTIWVWSLENSPFWMTEDFSAVALWQLHFWMLCAFFTIISRSCSKSAFHFFMAPKFDFKAISSDGPSEDFVLLGSSAVRLADFSWTFNNHYPFNEHFVV